MNLITALQSNNLINKSVVEAALAEMNNGVDQETSLINAGVDADSLRNLAAKLYGVPAYTPPEGTALEQVKISKELLSLIPKDSAAHYRIIPLAKEDNMLLVGANQPDDLKIRGVLNSITTHQHIPYKISYILNSDLDILIQNYTSLTGDVDQAIDSFQSEWDDQESTLADGEKKEEIGHISEDAPVTKIVGTILKYAVDGAASDIHIEAYESKVRVRFRIDGLLKTSLELPMAVQPALVARVKILSSLRLDEHRRPQDGRFSTRFDGNHVVDFRVSLLPTNVGEKIVLRVLDKGAGVNSLENTGVSGHNMELIKKATKEPHGIILVSGPTGSGKSTTLYSMLNEVDKDGKNVVSLEDPVEYNIEGVNQSQVQSEIGYTFAAGLRSILRQDPDIILVGEIRDKETAQLAIQAALTGHLVFSTIHTNSAIGVIPRLLDMGVDPFLIAPTLRLVIAQRLSRRLYEGKGREEPITEEMAKNIRKEFETLPPQFHDRIPQAQTIKHPQATAECESGTKGRVAVTECLEISGDIERLIFDRASDQEIFDRARQDGFMTLKEDAIIKALEHIIPYEEVGVFGLQAELDEKLGDIDIDTPPPDTTTPDTADPQAAPTAPTAPTAPNTPVPATGGNPNKQPLSQT